MDVGKPSLMLLEQLRRPREEGGMGVDFSRAATGKQPSRSEAGSAGSGRRRPPDLRGHGLHVPLPLRGTFA